VSTYIEYVHARPEFDEVLFQLSKGNSFTAGDLESNRKGKVGADQMRHHFEETLAPPLMLLAAGMAVSLVTRVSFAAYVERQNIFHYIATLSLQLLTFHFDKFREMYLTTQGNHLPLVVGLFVITAPMTAYRKLRRVNFRLIFDLLFRGVKKQEGAVYAVTEEVKAPGRAGKQGEMISHYYFVVNEKKIKVSAEGYKSITLGLRYKVYYLPTSLTLVSMEPIIG
jgi:hypothetical protein